jgi:hypothetical protein
MMICEQIGEEQETGTVPSVYALGLPIGVSNGAERRLARERAGRAKEAKQTHRRDKGGKNLQINNLQGRYGPNPNRAGNIPRGIVVLCQSHIPFFLGSLQLVCGSKQYTRLYPPTNLPDQNLPVPNRKFGYPHLNVECGYMSFHPFTTRPLPYYYIEQLDPAFGLAEKNP